MSNVSLIIGGEDVAAASGATFERRNPVSNAVVSTAAAAGPEDAKRAVEAAAAAFPAWSGLPATERRAMLLAAAARLRERGPDLVAAMTAETGSTAGWGHFNVYFAGTLLEEAAAMTTQIAGEIIPSGHSGTMAMGVRQAAGVSVGMAPWNAPVILGVRAIAMPLACGNTVVMKSSETCPYTHYLIGEVMRAAGLPPGVVNVISHSAEGAPAVVEALIAHPATRRVNFTGSTRVGRIVGELAGRHLKPAVLELGGKAPLVVLADADLDEAVAAASFGAFMHQGQICMSTERIIVDRSVADAFVGKLKAKTESLTVGDPATTNAHLGAVVDTETVGRLNRLIDDAVGKGATLVCGGKGDSVLFAPTLLDNVTPQMGIFREESFGPAVGVIRVDGVEEAISMANDTEYGLSAAVFGRDAEHALEVARRIDSGICHVNSATVQDEAQMPFGGVKASGFGRFGGRAAINEFTDLRWISVATQPRHYPI
jgi:acyl-CoA reductase-like NAD-dependent aldehyde dehydrogenase